MTSDWDAETGPQYLDGDVSQPQPRYGSPFTVRFLGGPAGDEGTLQWIPLRDLSHTPFICSGDGPYYHFTQRGEPDDRTYVYAGECAELPHLNHAHPGPSHGHN